MYTLQIEHGIKDFPLWKDAFDRDPLDRGASGVRAYRIECPTNQDHYVVVELDFDTRDAAAGFLARLRTEVWNRPAASPALAGEPSTRILKLMAAA
ncbi:hypothetical protein ACQCSX_20165 [Pseudarthrobacter sp. P1]|uniref:hypothetical protein n=1 Tax=Pseudarthrobacter sp. P1 TaxID=3418418 RepID=UPI003CF3B66B